MAQSSRKEVYSSKFTSINTQTTTHLKYVTLRCSIHTLANRRSKHLLLWHTDIITSEFDQRGGSFLSTMYNYLLKNGIFLLQ